MRYASHSDSVRTNARFGLGGPAKETAHELDDVLHVAADVVEHHRHEKQPDEQEPAFENALARARAEGASLDRLRNVENNLAAIENGYGQQVEHCDVDADERD